MTFTKEILEKVQSGELTVDEALALASRKPLSFERISETEVAVKGLKGKGPHLKLKIDEAKRLLEDATVAAFKTFMSNLPPAPVAEPGDPGATAPAGGDSTAAA